MQNIGDNLDLYLSLNDEELFNMMKKNEGNAFKFIFKKYYNRLLGYAMRFVQDRETAEDIIQEVFMSFWEKRQLLKSISLSSLLFCMVRNASLNYLRGLL